MDFNFTSEQTQLADAVRRYLTSEYDFETRKKIVYSDLGVSDSAWTQLVELGLTALPMPEEHGGFGGTGVDMLVVMQEFGRGLVIEPYFATVFAAELIKRAGTGAQLAHLDEVGAGSVKLAAALGERQSRYDLFDVHTTLTAGASGYVLNGIKTVVTHGAQADYFVVSARSSGASRDETGISLVLVAKDAPGIVVTQYRTIDGQRAADVAFNQVALGADALLGAVGRAWPVIDAVCDYGVALLCAEAVGVMESLNAQTLEYAKTRKQFGQPIAKFQALQHRMVEMFMQLEQARSMAYLAAVNVDHADATERRRIMSAAKARVGQAARYIGQEAVQIHGGMGVTNELPAAHYFKRLTMLELTLGDTDHHLARFVANQKPVPSAMHLKQAA